MKVFISLISILFVLFFASCKKETSDPNIPADSTTRVQAIMQYVDSSFSNVFSLTTLDYDASGRCLVQSTNNTIQNLRQVDSFFYSGSIVKWKKATFFNSSPSDISSSTTTYNLDANGRAYYSADNSTDSIRTNYFYDASGYLIKKIVHTINYIDTTFYSNTEGNQTYIDYGGRTNATQTFNSKTNFVGMENRGVSFLGKQNKNLVLTTIWNINTDYSSHDIYEYSYDSKGRLDKQIEISGLLNKSYYLSYYYK